MRKLDFESIQPKINPIPSLQASLWSSVLLTQHTPTPKPPSSSLILSHASISCTLSSPPMVTSTPHPPHSVSYYFNSSSGVLPSTYGNPVFSQGHGLSSFVNDIPSYSGIVSSVRINYCRPKKYRKVNVGN